MCCKHAGQWELSAEPGLASLLLLLLPGRPPHSLVDDVAEALRARLWSEREAALLPLEP